MPTGTRNSISANSATKPMMATASVLMVRRSFDRLDLVLAAHQLGPEDQPVGANRDQQHGGGVAGPGDQEERPGRQAQLERRQVGVVSRNALVQQRVGLHGYDEQQHQRREHVDDALPAWAG